MMMRKMMKEMILTAAGTRIVAANTKTTTGEGRALQVTGTRMMIMTTGEAEVMTGDVMKVMTKAVWTGVIVTQEVVTKMMKTTVEEAAIVADVMITKKKADVTGIAAAVTKRMIAVKAGIAVEGLKVMMKIIPVRVVHPIAGLVAWEDKVQILEAIAHVVVASVMMRIWIAVEAGGLVTAGQVEEIVQQIVVPAVPAEEVIPEVAVPTIQAEEVIQDAAVPIAQAGEVIPEAMGQGEIPHPAADPNLRVQEAQVPAVVHGTPEEVLHREDQRPADPAPGAGHPPKTPAAGKAAHPAEKKAVHQGKRKADK
jgi:hypothetical protein